MNPTKYAEFSPANIIFVGGSPRSGTTLVQRFLNTHPDVYGGPEFDMIPRLMEDYEMMATKVRKGRIDSWISESSVRRVFRNLLVDVFSTKAKLAGVSRISEKTPSNVLVFSQLREIMPDAVFIFVIRDPRAIAASMLAVASRQRKQVGRCDRPLASTRSVCKWIDSHMRAGLMARRDNTNLIVVRYEDFVADQSSASSRLYAQLELGVNAIPLKESTFDIPTDPETWQGNYYSKEQLEGGVHFESVERWKNELGFLQKRYIKDYFSQMELIAETYQLTGDANSFTSRFVCLMFRLSDTLIKWSRKIGI